MNLTDKQLIDYYIRAASIRWYEKYEFLLFIMVTWALITYAPTIMWIAWLAVGVFVTYISGFFLKMSDFVGNIKEEMESRGLI